LPYPKFDRAVTSHIKLLIASEAQQATYLASDEIVTHAIAGSPVVARVRAGRSLALLGCRSCSSSLHML